MSFAITGAILGGLSVASTVYGAHEAGSAAREVKRGADAATAESARQYDQTRADFAPYRAAGTGAINALSRLFGLGGGAGSSQWSGRDLFGSQGGIPTVDAERYAADPAYRSAWDSTLAAERASPSWRNPGASTYYAPGTNADFARLNDSLSRGIADYNAAHPDAAGPGGTGTPDMSGFFTSPNYSFVRGEGLRGIEGRFAARGGARSGNALRALAEFNSNLASGEFGNYVNYLSGIAGTGQTSTNQTAAYGADAANTAGRNALIAGDARASGIADRTNAVLGGVQNLATLGGYLGWGRKRALPVGGTMSDYAGSGINPWRG